MNKFLPGDLIATMSDHGFGERRQILLESAWMGVVISSNTIGYHVMFLGRAKAQYPAKHQHHIIFYEYEKSWTWGKVE